MPLTKPILIVAHSGRLLAQAAHAIGLKPVVIDCFGDLDTQYYAEKCYQITSLAQSDLIPAIEQMMRQHTVAAVIYGSGFEYYPESLQALAARFNVLGNDLAVFARLQDKVDFFRQLDRLAIAHPAVSFTPPDTAGWLIKPIQGQGGAGIQAYLPSSDLLERTGVYWQQFQVGYSYSVLFLAGHGELQVVGFNCQWCGGADPYQPFLFAGIRNHAELPREQKTVILAWLRQLIAEFGLKGMNTLDFIIDGGQCYVLEINPRPSASMQLYPTEWLLRHIQACRGETHYVPVKNDAFCSGYQVLYATQSLAIPESFDWPACCMDLPKSGTIIATAQPICSIIARGQHWQEVKALLQMRQQSLLYKLTKSV